jgi:hypothetical protein
MKKLTKLKAMVLSVAMAFGMLLPNAAFAQNDDFFRSEDNFGGNRDFTVTWAATSQNFGDAPLGTGLLIMLGAGAGYALLKKKEEKI